jgi:murein DD-endopeptidase MepM/ murein hydrolase activator NlpD
MATRLRTAIWIALTSVALTAIIYRAAAEQTSLSPYRQPGPQVSPTQTPYPPASLQASIETAILQAIQSQEEAVPAYLMTETQVSSINLSPDRMWATAQLNPVDPDTKETIPAEPGLAILYWDNGKWQTVLPTDSNWDETVKNSPNTLISEENKELLLLMNAPREAAMKGIGPFTGYYLPWEGGKSLYVSQTVKHDKYTPNGSAHYSFDFYKPQAMFDIYAAKSGSVSRARWTCKNGDENCGNYLVIEDFTTNPVSYILYLHLAQNSIPEAFRQSGALVKQGEFIGVADDTGQSTGHHLHFMVHTSPSSYWGTSVDIQFNDVSMNGGRPRIKEDLPYCRNDSTYQDVCNTFSYSYTSGNVKHTDDYPPTGQILSPVQSSSANDSNLQISGTASDQGSGLASIQILSFYQGEWHPVGSKFNQAAFSVAWDMCADDVPDGPVSLALKILDNQGNESAPLTALTHFSKNAACTAPPAACVPTQDQVAIFSDPDYQGSCVILGNGTYTSPASFGNVGVNAASSIQVGANVIATLFINPTLKGRGDTFSGNDRNLADNIVGARKTQSMIIEARTSLPDAPRLVWPANSSSFPAFTSLSLAWENQSGATQYQAVLQAGETQIPTNWQSDPVWHIGSFYPGVYSWKVKARNSRGESSWSPTYSFTIENTPSLAPSTPVQTVPYSDTMEMAETLWTPSTNWQHTNDLNHTPTGNSSWRYAAPGKNDYNTGAANSGDLTSPPFQIPASGAYGLHFWYNYEAESSGKRWDNRWLQISNDGGPFVNSFQLSDDQPNYWLQSPEVSLAEYAGHTIRIRFHFETLDEAFNDFKGWYIDDFSISPTTLNCGSNPTPDQILALNYNSPAAGKICPAGKFAWYSFTAEAGKTILAQTTAQSTGSPLDTVLTLYDSDGVSVLAENDDILTSVQTDSRILYRIPATGTYYLRVRAWDHPGGGGENYTFTISLKLDDQAPTGMFLYPTDGRGFATKPIILKAQAQDAVTGVVKVEFSYHDNNWASSDWIYLGEDTSAEDGWSFPYDASGLSGQPGYAFYARAYDAAGNSYGFGAWNLHPGTSNYFLPFIRH